MSKKGPPSSKSFLLSVRINLDLHSEPVLEKRMEEKVMVPFKILDSNPLKREPMEFVENGKVFRKRKTFRRRAETHGLRGIFESEKKVEEIA